MDLTDRQWTAIRHYFPQPAPAKAGEEFKKPGRLGGRPWRPVRDVLNGVLWILRTGAPWRDLPSRYPPYQTCHRRFQRWVAKNVLRRVVAGLRRDLCCRGGIEDVEGYIDGTYVPAKKGVTASESVALAMRRRSWHLQTATVFHSRSLLQRETDMRSCSLTKRSTLHSSPIYRRA